MNIDDIVVITCSPFGLYDGIVSRIEDVAWSVTYEELAYSVHGDWYYADEVRLATSEECEQKVSA